MPGLYASAPIGSRQRVVPDFQLPDDLRAEIAAADFVIMKGDANYRRLLGRRSLAPHVGFPPPHRVLSRAVGRAADVKVRDHRRPAPGRNRSASQPKIRNGSSTGVRAVVQARFEESARVVNAQPS